MTTDPHLPPTKAIILAAGVGSRIRPLTDNSPKSLLLVAGMPILERMIRNIEACGISEFIIVLGYLENQIREFVNTTFPHLDVTFISNHRYAETNTGYSLMLALAEVEERGFVKFDADVVFDVEILRRLIASDADNVMCIDRNIHLDAEEIKVVLGDEHRVLRASKTLDPKTAAGESIGIEKIGAEAASILFAELTAMMVNRSHLQDYYEAAYERLIAKDVAFQAVDITGLNWVEIDTHDDFAAANQISGFKREVQAGPMTSVY